MSERMVSASEIGEYAYCPRAWWLGRVAGAVSANADQLAAGTKRHERHAGLVTLADWAWRGGLAALLAAAVLLAVVLASGR